MAMIRDSSDWDLPERRDEREPAVERRSIRPSVADLGHGAFACPACDLPLLPAGPIGFSAPVECPFCRNLSPARQYVRLDVLDTPANAVYLRARLPA
jgi:hypothetical protein